MHDHELSEGRTSTGLTIDVLLALELGALLASLNVFALGHVGRDIGAVLLWPKRVFSNLIGSNLGWTAHLQEADPIGVWLQLMAICLLSGAVILVVLRRSRGPNLPPSRGVAHAFAAVLIPWFCTLLTAPALAPPTSLMSVVGLVAPLAAMALSVRACLLLSERSAIRKIGEPVAELLVSLALLVVFVESGGSVARPLIYGAVLAGSGLIAVWAAAQRREPNGRA